MAGTGADEEKLLQGVGALVWEADAEGRHFRFVSKHAEKLFGYPAERWTAGASSWGDHVHPADGARVSRACEALMQGGGSGDLESRAVLSRAGVVRVRAVVCVI